MTQNQFEIFPPANKSTWESAAKKELKGENPFVKLNIDAQGLTRKPYYDGEDTKDLPVLALSPSHDPYLGPRAWYNMPKVSVENVTEANRLALEHLDGGADGILFETESKIDIPGLLHEIELPYCTVSFVVAQHSVDFCNEFVQYVHAKKYNSDEINGGIFSARIPADMIPMAAAFKGWKRFYPLGLFAEKSSNPSTEIAQSLATVVRSIRETDAPDSYATDLLSSFAFSFSIESDFFLEIAKLKAFRRLWVQILQAFKVQSEKESAPFIHAVSEKWIKEAFEPNANMLKSTTAAIAAILGGCNGLTVIPENQTAVKERIARNVSNILREESHLNWTADATAGSYYIESLTHQLATKAWAEFQKLV